MGLKKCPRCELNYIKDDEKLCNVCKRTAKHEEEPEEEAICIECGEHPAMKGKDICAECYKESLRQEHLHNQRSNLDYEDVDGVSGVTLPDEEIPTGSLPDELADEFEEDIGEDPKQEEGEIEFSKDLSYEKLSEEEDMDYDEDDEYDEGITPARMKHKNS